MKQSRKVLIAVLLAVVLMASFAMTQPVLADNPSPQVLCHYDHSETGCSWCALLLQYRFWTRDIYVCDDGGTYTQQYNGACPSC